MPKRPEDGTSALLFLQFVDLACRMAGIPQEPTSITSSAEPQIGQWEQLIFSTDCLSSDTTTESPGSLCCIVQLLWMKLPELIFLWPSSGLFRLSVEWTFSAVRLKIPHLRNRKFRNVRYPRYTRSFFRFLLCSSCNRRAGYFRKKE